MIMMICDEQNDDSNRDEDGYLVNNMNNSVGCEDVSCCDPGTVGHHHLVKMRRKI